MDPLLVLPLTPGGVLLAVACAIAGAPVFARGLRALRARRALAGLQEVPLAEEVAGVVRVTGKVTLESPLFGPLSGKQCAGYDLVVCGVGSAVGGTVRERRSFRLESGDASARVMPENADWYMPVTAKKTLAAGEATTERLRALLASSPELRWLHGRRVALELVERSLEAGRNVSVVAVARTDVIFHLPAEEELAATGTDGPFAAPRLFSVPESEDRELVLESGEALERVQVHADPPRRAAVLPSRWRASLAFIGPALTLVALLYLVRAGGTLLARM